MINNPALYALVPKAALPRTRGRVVTMPASPGKKKHAAAAVRNVEHRTKQAVDVADALLTRLEERAAAYSKEIARLQRRKAFAHARIERLEDAILTRMDKAALKEANGWKRTLICRPAPASVDVFDETLLPETYLRKKEVSAPDKHAIREALNADIEVPGAKLYQRLTLVRK